MDQGLRLGLALEFFLLTGEGKDLFSSWDDRRKKLAEPSLLDVKRGGKIRLFFEPSFFLRDLQVAYAQERERLRPLLAKEDLRLLALGLAPDFSMDALSGPSASLKADAILEKTARTRLFLQLGEGRSPASSYLLLLAMTPIFDSLFANAPILERTTWTKHNAGSEVRRKLAGREGLYPPQVFSPDFSRATYLDWLGKKRLPSLENPAWDQEGLFLDLDALPFSYALGAAALWKGLFSHPRTLQRLEGLFLPAEASWIERGKNAGRDHGLQAFYRGRYMVNWGLDLLTLAREKLSPQEGGLLDPLEKLWLRLESPAEEAARLFQV